jgi:nitrate reductase NapE component
VSSEKEILLLQSYAVIMLRSNVPTKEILIALCKRSKIFKSNFELAVKKYSTNPEAAFKNLKESSNSNNFRKTCIALEQSFKTDNQVSLRYLENNRVFTREVNKQHRLRKNKRNEIIGTLLLIFPLFMLIAIGAYPWIIYILRLLNNMPM